MMQNVVIACITLLVAGGIALSVSNGPAAARLGAALDALIVEGGVRVSRDIAYGSHARHRLDVYEPETADRNGPVAIFYYGGGWTEGERAYYAFIGAALASRGITTIIPDY
jgi:acetyl esterase/lipase